MLHQYIQFKKNFSVLYNDKSYLSSFSSNLKGLMLEMYKGVRQSLNIFNSTIAEYFGLQYSAGSERLGASYSALQNIIQESNNSMKNIFYKEYDLTRGGFLEDGEVIGDIKDESEDSYPIRINNSRSRASNQCSRSSQGQRNSSRSNSKKSPIFSMIMDEKTDENEELSRFFRNNHQLSNLSPVHHQEKPAHSEYSESNKENILSQSIMYSKPNILRNPPKGRMNSNMKNKTEIHKSGSKRKKNSSIRDIYPNKRVSNSRQTVKRAYADEQKVRSTNVSKIEEFNPVINKTVSREARNLCNVSELDVSYTSNNNPIYEPKSRRRKDSLSMVSSKVDSRWKKSKSPVPRTVDCIKRQLSTAQIQPFKKVISNLMEVKHSVNKPKTLSLQFNQLKYF